MVSQLAVPSDAVQALYDWKNEEFEFHPWPPPLPLGERIILRDAAAAAAIHLL